MTELEHRDRINFLRLLLIIGLVFLHYGSFPDATDSPYQGFAGFHSPTPVASFLNVYFIFIFYSAVPVLGAVSGYLFFKNWKPGLGFYAGRIKSRTFSILLPMLSWCAIILAIFVVIHLVSPNSRFLPLISYDLDNFGFRQFINALAGITRRPINFQFWFLRDLFLTVLCTPILGLLIRRVPYIGLAVIGVIWLVDYDLPVYFRNDVLFFFYLGALIRVRGWELDFISPRAATIAMAIYLAVAALRTVAPAFVPDDTLLGELVYGPGTRLMRLLGVVAFWGCAPYLMRTLIGRQIAAWGGLAFFLHAIHWPLNQFVKAGLATFLPTQGDAGLLLNYFGTVSLTLAVSFVIAWMLNGALPSLFSHLSGGRAFRRTEPSGRNAVLPVAEKTATSS